MRSWVYLSCVGVVAQPWRRAEKLVIISGSCVAPLWLGGLRGKQSTPSVWLGGTGEPSAVGEAGRGKERGTAAQSAGRRTPKQAQSGNGMILILAFKNLFKKGLVLKCL